MAAGLRDKAAAINQPRDRPQQTILDGQSQANVGPPNVAQCGETAIDAGRKKPRRKVRQVRHRRLHNPDDVQPRSIHVNVRIDQPGHQDTAAAIDDLVLAARRPSGDFADHTAFHENVFPGSQRFRCAIEDAGRLKDNSSLHHITSRGRRSAVNHSEGRPRINTDLILSRAMMS
jgi:hypothetical protein